MGQSRNRIGYNVTRNRRQLSQKVQKVAIQKVRKVAIGQSVVRVPFHIISHTSSSFHSAKMQRWTGGPGLGYGDDGVGGTVMRLL